MFECCFFEQVSEPRMTDIADAIHVNQQPRQIRFVGVWNHVRLNPMDPGTMFQGLESEVDIPHVPVEVLHPTIAICFDIPIELIQHLTL